MNRLTRENEVERFKEAIKGQLELCGEAHPKLLRYVKLAEYEDTGLEPKEIKGFGIYIDDLRKELREYKDLEEQGLLIKLPCKVADTVFIYADFTKNLEPYTVEAIHLGSCYTMQFDCNLYMLDELIDSTEFELEDIGKTVFLTREEAEKALEGK